MTLRTRQLFFRAVLLLTPCVILMLLEISLRLAGVFAPERLVVDVPASGGRLSAFNPFVTNRYFSSGQTAVPMLAPEVFLHQKTSQTFRVLCLGESSVAGFPFECQVPFPRQLRQMLAEACPGRRIEVLNAGIAAVSSHVIADLLPELLTIEPDLIIVYTGHNEFYGVYGSGSSLSGGGRPWLVRASLALQHLHLAQAMKAVIGWIGSSKPDTSDSRTLMQHVVGDQTITFMSPRYETTVAAFRENLTALLEKSRERGIPVLLATLVSNERDLPPFRSNPDPGTTDHTGPGLKVGQGVGYLAAGRVEDARAIFVSALEDDSGHAGAWYGYARTLLQDGDTVSARRWFRGARDRDLIRFRAPSDFNGVIRSLVREGGARLVDLDSIFASRSQGGITGSGLICDHLHPNPDGYYLMARAFFDAIKETDILRDIDRTYTPPSAPYGVTALDWEIGLMKVFVMVHRWPFPDSAVTVDDYHPQRDSTAARVAREYLFGHNIWSRAHHAMAEHWLRRGDGNSARREYEAIAVFSPDDPWPHVRIAEIYRDEKNWNGCSAALQQAIRRPGQRGMLYYQLALSESALGHREDAVRWMTAATQAPEFTQAQLQNARFYLAGFYSDAGKRDMARRILTGLLAEDPSFVPAQRFLEKLERMVP